MNIRDQLLELAWEMGEEKERGFQLWALLPSFYYAMRGHPEMLADGDGDMETLQPDTRNLLREAREIVAWLLLEEPVNADTVCCPCEDGSCGFDASTVSTREDIQSRLETWKERLRAHTRG